MFQQNKYSKWYFDIVNRAGSRVTNGYVERHHIVPKSLGGSNDQTNLVKLTAKEHFICHLLLVKMTTGKDQQKMWHAAWNMLNRKRLYQDRYKVTSRIYEFIRKNNAKALSQANTGKPSKLKGRVITPEWREKLRQANLGKKRSAESVAKQSSTMKGRVRTMEEREAISKGLKGREFTIEWRKKISDAAKARYRKDNK